MAKRRRMARTKVSLQALLGRGRKPAARSAQRANEDNPALQAIWDVVAQIPRGRISTYGDVAREAGLPGRARQAGYALKHAPDGMHLPWHRVVGAGGKIAFPPASRAHREQTRRLRSEGVSVANGRVDRTALLESSLGD
jgi:methylated-DNA-protein-cysteine methyltransferase related protein